MRAALLRRAPRMWRSMQLTDTLIRPPTNHLACGGSLQSSTRLHGRLHSSSDANRAQNASGSRSASSYAAASLTIALAWNSVGGSKTRSSWRSAEISGFFASAIRQGYYLLLFTFHFPLSTFHFPLPRDSASVVVLEPKVGDQFLAHHVAQRVLELHQLDKQVVLGVEPGGVHRTLEVERQPLLDAGHAGALGEIEKQRQVEHDRRREDAVAAEEVDLQLHLVAEPAHQVDIVPALFIVAARRIVVDADDVMEIFVEAGVEMRLQDVVEHG